MALSRSVMSSVIRAFREGPCVLDNDKGGYGEHGRHGLCPQMTADTALVKTGTLDFYAWNSKTSLCVPVFTNEVPVTFRGIRVLRVRSISANRSS